MSVSDGPDFICIGMPKAGTGWFYDQLSHHSDFWMPPVKELHYLDRKIPELKNALRLLESWDLVSRRARQGLTWGERERAFLEDVVSCAGEPKDVARYAMLFRHKGDLLSGDTSPGYCALDDGAIREISTELPRTKIVLLVREPVSRMWSRICMAARDGKFDVSLLENPIKFREFIKTKRYLYATSFPTQIIQRWSRYFPPDLRLRVVLFDDIVHRPTETLQDILRFIGADPFKRSQLPPDYNPKSKLKKLQMPNNIRDILLDYLAEEVRNCASLLGGAARAWPSVWL
jgi:hypothetical protein